jgi:hypothetical protein
MGSRPDVTGFFFNMPNPSSRNGPGVDSAYNRNEYQGVKGDRLAFIANNLTVICDPIV